MWSIGWGIVGTGEAGVAQVPLRVFPNPAKEYATVLLPEGHGWSALMVYDVLGREVLHTAVALGADSVEFNTGLLVSGLYLVMPLGERGEHSNFWCSIEAPPSQQNQLPPSNIPPGLQFTKQHTRCSE